MENNDILEAFEEFKKFRRLCECCQISVRKPNGQLKSVYELLDELNKYYLKNCQDIRKDEMT